MKTKRKEESKHAMEWIIWSFIALSFALLSFYQILQYKVWCMIFTVIVSFVVGLFFIKKTYKENLAYIKEHPFIFVFLGYISIQMVRVMFQVKGFPDINVGFQAFFHFLFRLRCWLLSVPALWYVLLWFWRKVTGFLFEFIGNMDAIHRKIYFSLTIVSFIGVLFLYAVNPQWHLQYDLVYSIDSGWCYGGIFSQPFYYDIRHPVLNVVAFPIWGILSFTLRLFVPAQLLDGLCISLIQFLNIQCLLLVGFMIEKLSKSMAVLLLYLVSSPVLLFSCFMEKYQICTFLLVLYVYRRCEGKKNTEAGLILATGAMATSFFLIISEFLLREPFHEKLRRFCNIIMEGILFLTITGRAYLLNPFALLEEVSYMTGIFTAIDYSIWERSRSFMKMVHSSFWGLSSRITEESRYLWTDIVGSVSILGIFICLIIMVGMIANRKDPFVRICFVWTVFAAALFIIFQWSVYESPLFNIYFLWALIPLFQKGLQVLIKKLNFKEKYVYAGIAFSMLLVNVLNLIDIELFLKQIAG